MKNILFTAVLFSLIFCSCTKQKKEYVPSVDTIQLEIEEAPITLEKKNSKWSNENGCILVLLGYGFNTDSFINTEFNSLVNKFGLDENGGLLYPVTFPDDFKHGNTTRVSDLNNFINDKNLKGILLLGAPEGINIPLSKQNDIWNGKLPYSVFSFFPQEDVLAMEATADFILEEDRSKEDAALEQINQTIDPAIYPIIDFAIRYMAELPAPLPKDTDLHTHVQQIAGKSFTVRRYVDSETGLQSINHFVMEKN